MSLHEILFAPITAFSSMANDLGITKPEKITLLLSLISGAIGALLDYTLKRDNWEQYSVEEAEKMPFSRSLPLQLGRLFIGIVVAGYTWGLLFSSMADTKEARIKLIVLCGFAGLSAPAIASRWKKSGEGVADNRTEGTPAEAQPSNPCEGSGAPHPQALEK